MTFARAAAYTKLRTAQIFGQLVLYYLLNVSSHCYGRMYYHHRTILLL